MNELGIEVVEASKSFGKIKALDKLSFAVSRGEMLGLLGPNGAGKSTTIGLLCGLVIPDGGIIRVLGKNVRTGFIYCAARMGVLLENPAFYEHLSARDNLLIAARLKRCKKEPEVDNLLQRVGLWARRKGRVGTFSKGMRQRLGIARALVGSPDVLLLDEPVAHLDPWAADEVLSWLNEWVRELSASVLIATHAITEVERLCDRVCVIDNGRVRLDGPVFELQQRTDCLEYRLELDCPEDMLKAMSLLERHPKVGEVSQSGRRCLAVRMHTESAADLNSYLVNNMLKIRSFGPLKSSFREVILRACKGQ
jgi:ABC-type multidrug transport system ATPase subunit